MQSLSYIRTSAHQHHVKVGRDLHPFRRCRWCTSLNIGPNVLKRDYAFYKASVDKVAQVKEMVLQMKASAKRQEAAKLKAEAEEAEKEAAEAEAAEAEAAEAAESQSAVPAAGTETE